MAASPTLIILAAGMGSRYGGLKQLEPMGLHGETLLDYSVYDALQAGFDRIVFVIRRDIEAPFRSTIGKRYEKLAQLEYAFQELSDLPRGFSLTNEERLKPWGTAHALFAARHSVEGDFAVINADDFYGAQAYHVLARHFIRCGETSESPFCMVGFPLQQTLSRHGAVNRGICQIENGLLRTVEEVIDIEPDREGTILGTDTRGEEVQLSPETIVSMNFWGFSDRIFPDLEQQFGEFLQSHGNSMSAEFYIPSFVDTMISEGRASCQVLSSSDRWFGVTYPKDRPFVQDHLGQLVAEGTYPSPLLP